MASSQHIHFLSVIREFLPKNRKNNHEILVLSVCTYRLLEFGRKLLISERALVAEVIEPDHRFHCQLKKKGYVTCKRRK